MTIASGDARRATSHHVYRAMRDFVQSMDDILPGKFEITKQGIVHDMMAPNRPHEFTSAQISRRLERVMPDELLAHTGAPDVEDEPENIMRLPDIIVIAQADMEGQGSFNPRTGPGAVLSDIHSTPEGPRYATRKDFIYGEDVTIAEWAISTEGLPRYE
ncbi:Uma2 family endonuclease [Streptomyces sp. NPDC004732]|uniref:Uma2 family endonuclease n=1 Tax=Streptomyces sp. NPDC004732 TaxID=3154290 RepID=UPI0033BAE546